jgi:hypothetical protein
LEARRNYTWAWVVGGVAGLLLLLALAGLIGVAIKRVSQTRLEATSLASILHERMEMKDWNGIYATASPEYREAMGPEKSEALFDRIDRELGPPMATTQTYVQVKADNSGSYLMATFLTKFGKDDPALETISWKKVEGQYRLQRYNIRSDALKEG